MDLAPLYAAIDSADVEQLGLEHPELLTVDAAAAAREEAAAYLRAGDAVGCLRAFRAAEMLFGVHEEHEQAHRVWLDRVAFGFLLAEEDDLYVAVHQDARALAAKAAEGDPADLVMKALTVAADAALFAAGVTTGEVSTARLRSALDAAAEAGDWIGPEVSGHWRERWASASYSVLREVRTRYWGDDGALGRRGALRRLVGALDAGVDPGLEFAGYGELTKLAHLSAYLAGVMDEEGMAPSRASAERLREVKDRAAAQGDLDAWFACAQALRRYGGAWVSDSERAELREGVLRLVLGSRSQARSRLARLLESASLDAVVGDELAQNLESGDVDFADVFALTEYASARTLLDGVAGLGTAAPDDPECARLERAITAYTAPDDDSPIARQMRLVSELPLGSTQEERAERSGLVAELEQRYAALGCGYEGMAEPVSLAAAQERLGADELLVRYVLPYHALHPAYLPSVLVVTRTEARLVRLPVPDSGVGLIGRLSIDGRAPVDASPLGNEVVLARSAMDGGLDGDASPHLHRLYAMLVEPVLSTGLAANRNRWVIAPQRSLHLVPWMALQDASGRWLLDDAAVTIAPSASVWAALRRRPPRPAGALAAVGDPLVGYAGLPQLPGARAEVDHLAGLFQASGRPVRSLLGAAATYDGLVGAVQHAGLVHVATHGSFPEDGALFDHRILLSQDLGRPGPVTTDALRRLDLGAAWCVTLSVCNGGVFRVGPGDEPYGLVPAVLEAGSPTVVAAQWAVDDDAGRELMRRVADRIVEVGPAEALRGAVLEARRAGARPARDYTAFLAIGTGLGPAGDTSNVMEGRDR